MNRDFQGSRKLWLSIISFEKQMVSFFLLFFQSRMLLIKQTRVCKEIFIWKFIPWQHEYKLPKMFNRRWKYAFLYYFCRQYLKVQNKVPNVSKIICKLWARSKSMVLQIFQFAGMNSFRQDAFGFPGKIRVEYFTWP